MRRVMLMASGGLDSTTVAYQLADKGIEILPIFFDYGQHCAETEWRLVNEVLPPTAETPERNNISDLFRGSRSRLVAEANLWEDEVNDDDLYIPYRTLLFYAASAARAQTLGIREVYTGFINSNHAKEIDCTAEFMNKLDGLTDAVGPVRFISPFRNSSKADVTREAIRLGVPVGRTFSCQAASRHPCGACPNCVERLGALREAGLLK
ncbi:7-cyano-7-deazaguanine synthase [Rhizobium sp. PAMB 3182]